MRLLSRPSALYWALAASVIVHAGFVAVTFGGGARGVAAITPRTLFATFTPAQTAPAEAPVIVATAPSVLSAPAQATPMPPAPPVSPAATAALPPAPRGYNQGLAQLEVAATPLTDRNRLGDLLGRQLAEFPAEIDRPARLDGAVVARYPLPALRAGREGSVAVWLVVDEQGHADEIQVIDGEDEFATEVVAALRAARFLPGRNNMKPIRFPLALQFEFRLGGNGAAVASK